MAPKKARVAWVDGVHCSHNFASGNVIVGTGLVSHDQRDCFRLKAHSTLEEQVRARPKFVALAAAAAAGGATGESLLPGVAAPREQAQPEEPKEPTHQGRQLYRKRLTAEEELNAISAKNQKIDAERRAAKQAATERNAEERRAARMANPCLCTKEGASELLRQSRQQTDEAQQVAKKGMAALSMTLDAWLGRHKGMPV